MNNNNNFFTKQIISLSNRIKDYTVLKPYKLVAIYAKVKWFVCLYNRITSKTKKNPFH